MKYFIGNHCLHNFFTISISDGHCKNDTIIRKLQYKYTNEDTILTKNLSLIFKAEHFKMV